jgi:tetratricopeptide (TPR) repeat protein
LNQALELSRRLKDAQGEAIILGNLGAVYNSLANYRQAIEYLNMSLIIADNQKKKFSGDQNTFKQVLFIEAMANGNLAKVYRNSTLD